jgi:hypothetical protein
METARKGMLVYEKRACYTTEALREAIDDVEHGYFRHVWILLTRTTFSYPRERNGRVFQVQSGLAKFLIPSESAPSILLIVDTFTILPEEYLVAPKHFKRHTNVRHFKCIPILFRVPLKPL